MRQMKSLWKISSRYIMTAVFITFFIFIINFIVFLYIGYQILDEGSNYTFSREIMEAIGNQLWEENGQYQMTQTGYELLEKSNIVWAMRIDSEGDVVWSYQLTSEIPLHYELADIAVLSRWYLKDYPVTVWRHGTGLMVYGYAKGSFVRLNLVSDFKLLREIPQNMLFFLVFNVVLLLVLVLSLAYRFYRSLKPLAGGIEALVTKEAVKVPERGVVKELAQKLNQAAATLQKQDEQLKRRDDARTSWIAGVSHDIRTPLALITGYSDEMIHEEMSRAEIRKKAEMIQKQSILIKQLIENLNLTSKLEYQAQPLKKELLSPALLVRECVAEYYNQGLDGTYELLVNIQPEVENQSIAADKGLLLRAFRNLIGNSIRHNPRGCEMTISLALKGDIIAFSFADSGEGIPEKVVNIVKGESEQTDYAPVHVMGLRIVKQIVQAHGGNLFFQKRQNCNYDVVLQVPAA